MEMTKTKKIGIFSLLFVVALVLGFLLLENLGIIERVDHEEAIETKSAKELDQALRARGLDEKFFKQPEKDLEKYFQENSEIIEKLSAKDPSNSYSEREADQVLKERGFKESPLVYRYDGEGNYIGETEIDGSKKDIHPSYEMDYYDEMGILWSIRITGKNLTASPIGDEQGNMFSKQIIFSEDEIMTSYDAKMGTFYRTKPKEKVLKVNRLPRIDKETLGKISKEIGGHEKI